MSGAGHGYASVVSFSPRSLALFSWGYPRWHVERQENLHRILDHGSDREKFGLIRAVLF